jgi:tetratricopeptide (TPR) repeat protein
MSEAKQLVDAGQFGKAIELLQEGITKYPKMISARVMLGEIYRTSGDLALAQVELEQVIKAAPDNFAAHRTLALVYRDLGDKPSAIRACETILQANPKDREMRELLEGLKGEATAGKAAADDKAARAQKAKPAEKHEAVKAADEKVNIEEHSLAMDSAGAVTDSVTLADLYISQGHREKGLEVYRRLAAKEPNNPRLRDKIRALVEEGMRASHPAPVKASPETAEQTKRKARIRRLEGWLAAIRERRRT